VSARVLLVDDDRELCAWLEAALARRDFAVQSRSSAADALALCESEDFDVVVSDLNLRGASGLELCERIASSRPDTPVVVITAFGSMETAIAAIRAGAYDFVTKPFEIDAIQITLQRAAAHAALRREVKRLRSALQDVHHFEGLIGASPAMRELYDLLDRIAETDTSVLITGESGTGKELVAQAIHQRSARRSGPFVPINCAAMPDALLESELFGHVKGAFTDARAARAGLFLEADKGTIFFDELGELPLQLQPKLLRALQERKLRPVGGDQEIPFDVRVIAATNRDLETAIEEHRFREDLYYRVNVVHVHVPPLRQRASDVLLLAQHFLQRFAASLGKPVTALMPEAADRLVHYAWPGNVRELQNCMERAVALTRFDRIGVDDLPDKIRQHKGAPRAPLAAEDPGEVVPLEEVERRYIAWAVEQLGGNKTLAAQKLGVDRKTLYRKLQAASGGGAGRAPSGD
jgi:two-component system, NtrC family, response regulator AtoC